MPEHRQEVRLCSATPGDSTLLSRRHTRGLPHEGLKGTRTRKRQEQPSKSASPTTPPANALAPAIEDTQVEGLLVGIIYPPVLLLKKSPQHFPRMARDTCGSLS